MFDIAFSELLIIGIVALIVIGPERLPKVARTAGTWLGKLNRYVAQVKQDIDRDMQLEELRKLQSEMRASAQKYELLAEEASQKLQQEASQVDRVMKAMAATDGGLALQEYEKIKAEQAATLPAGESRQDGAPPSEAASEVTATAGAAVPLQRVPDDFQSSLDDEVLTDEQAAQRVASQPEAAVPGADGTLGQKT
jgi:sec-independent protein translocase protein TatB